MRTALLEPAAGLAGTPAVAAPLIRSAAIGDAARVARTLARAFFDDPVATYIAPRAATRMAKLERGWSAYLRKLWLRHGTTYMTGDGDGAAVWLPPGAAQPTPFEQLRVLPLTLAIGGRETPNLFRALSRFEAAHPQARHYYLPLIGVAPEKQAGGLGHALLQPILERCDRQGVPAYLEATNERCIGLYERNGFAVLDEVLLPNGGPPFWPMWRKPASS